MGGGCVDAADKSMPGGIANTAPVAEREARLPLF